ncbi:MAG: TRAP transporter TatT component family protein [Acidobacteriota bacterium]
MRAIPLLLLLSLPLGAQTDPLAPILMGDAAWARRAEGHQGERAAAGPVDEAIAAYERAVKEKPDRLEAYSKLLRALHYKGDYAVQDREGKQKVFARGREVFEAALAQIGRRTGKKMDDLTPQQVAAQVKSIPEATALYTWGAVHWGLWGDVYGRLAAARQGVGDKVRRNGEIALALDERYDQAAPHRVLGRLHTLAPKVPFVTGWVDRDQAVSHLRRAVALAPEDLLNQVYLADALLQHFPDKAAEAKEILRRVLQRKPVPERVVEDERALAEARRLLAGK